MKRFNDLIVCANRTHSISIMIKSINYSFFTFTILKMIIIIFIRNNLYILLENGENSFKMMFYFNIKSLRRFDFQHQISHINIFVYLYKVINNFHIYPYI